MKCLPVVGTVGAESWSSSARSSSLAAAKLRAVAALDPRPDTVEDVLNVCPQQAHRFGKQNKKTQPEGNQ